MGSPSVHTLTDFPLWNTTSAGAGACAAFLIRAIASQAGTPITNIHERILYELTRDAFGSGIDHVARWYANNESRLSHSGVRVMARRVAFRAPWLSDWVSKGSGFRATVLEVNRDVLQPRQLTGFRRHAVGLAAGTKKHPVLMINPWPGVGSLSDPPPTLERAHDAANRGAMVFHWSGWS